MKSRKIRELPARRDLLRKMALGSSLLAGGGLASLATAQTGGTQSTSGDGASDMDRDRVSAYPTLIDAENAIANGSLRPGELVDVLRHDRSGTGGGFRGRVLSAANRLLPGTGMLEPTETVLDVRMFGPSDTAGAATRTAQLALDWSAANQQIVHLPTRFELQEPAKISSNAGLVGLGAGFRCGFRPIDCPAIILDGDGVEGGFVFNVVLRDFGIWGDRVQSRQPYAMMLNRCYRSAIENVTFRGYAVANNRTQSVVSLSGIQNHMVLDRLTIIGSENGKGGYGVRIGNSANGGQIHFSHLDVEKTATSVVVEEGAQVQFLNPYFERFDTAVELKPGVRSVFINGGIFRFGSQRAAAIKLAAGRYDKEEHIAIIGSTFQVPRQDVAYRGIYTEGMQWINSSLIELIGIDRKSISISPAVRRAAGID